MTKFFCETCMKNVKGTAHIFAGTWRVCKSCLDRLLELTGKIAIAADKKGTPSDQEEIKGEPGV